MKELTFHLLTSDGRYMGMLHFQLVLHIVYSCFRSLLSAPCWSHLDSNPFIFMSPQTPFTPEITSDKTKECLCTLYNKIIIHGGTSRGCKETRLPYTSHWTKSLGEEKRPWKYGLRLRLIVHRFPHIYKDLPDIFQQLYSKSYWWSN